MISQSRYSGLASGQECHISSTSSPPQHGNMSGNHEARLSLTLPWHDIQRSFQIVTPLQPQNTSPVQWFLCYYSNTCLLFQSVVVSSCFAWPLLLSFSKVMMRWRVFLRLDVRLFIFWFCFKAPFTNILKHSLTYVTVLKWGKLLTDKGVCVCGCNMKSSQLS